MDFSSICRLCLNDENLYPIVKNKNQNEYSRTIFLTTGIKVSPNDGLPQNICTNCTEFVNKSLKFRKNCKETEIQLLKEKLLVKKEDFVTDLNDGKQLFVETLDYDETEQLEESVEFLDLHDIVHNNQINFNTADKKEIKLENQIKNELNMTIQYVETFEDDQLIKNGDENKALFDDGVKREVTKEDSSEIEAVTYKDNNRVTCNLCQKELSKRSIGNHMSRHHPTAVSKIKCEICEMRVSENKLRRHIATAHGRSALRCGYCKSEYDSKEVLIEHVSTCTAKKKTRKVCESSRELQECDICHKIMQKASLRMHKAVKHSGLRPVCEHCGRNFGNKYRLNEHRRAKHGYQKLKCTYCEFESAGVMAMRNHERRHRNEKPFVCETCGAKFHAAYLLTQHRQSHRTEKLIKCNLCPASFKANNSLHMHKLSCHSNYLFKCHLCSRVYSCRHYAVKHLRHVHDYKGPVPQLQKVPNDEANEQ